MWEPCLKYRFGLGVHLATRGPARPSIGPWPNRFQFDLNDTLGSIK